MEKQGCILLLTALSGVKAFNAKTAFVSRSQSFENHCKRSSVPLQAVVYYPSEWDGDNPEDDCSPESTAAMESPEFLAGQAWTAPLARLAAGNSPGLKIEDIEQVSVLGVGPSQLNIEALVCEVDGCVSLNVPVALPRPCEDDAVVPFQDCILENLEELDNLQQKAMSQSVFATQEEVEAAERLTEALRSTEGITSPDWWVTPDMDLVDQCTSLVEILNEVDFQSDIRKLVAKTSRQDEIGQVAVVAVGPAGVILRATARDEGGNVRVVEQSLKFPVVATKNESLRASVLDLVDDV